MGDAGTEMDADARDAASDDGATDEDASEAEGAAPDDTGTTEDDTGTTEEDASEQPAPDAGCSAEQRQTLFEDGDGDGHGDPARPREVCEAMDGLVDLGDDCNDRNPDVHPGARELCNERDDDCSSATADGVSDCSGLLCEAGSCRTSCSSQAHCLPGLECAGTSCTGKLPAGAGCGQDAHCMTGSCNPAGSCVQPGGLLADCNSAPDCQAGLSCVNGRCRRGNGQSCDNPGACTSNHCECANAACSARVCGMSDCARCRFDANGDGTCEGAIQSGQDDADNSCGATSCDGAGGCTGMVGAACGADANCVSNACGCDKADCPQRVCIPHTCPPCTYWNGSVCVYLQAGSEHPGSCEGVSACREGACVVGKSNGDACAVDAECVIAICAPRNAGGNTCGRGTGLCDSDVDCHVPGCTWDCGACKTATRACKLGYGPVGCTADDQCVNYCEVDEGECY